MPRDSTYAKRPAPKKRNVASMLPGGELVEKIYKDVSSGFGELKRQSGTAVARVKEGVEKIKRSLRR